MAGHKKLLVILCDGFKWDYTEMPGLELPGFQRLMGNGTRADYLEPVFPSLSFPNYYSLMTGLYCEDHGMVGNYMYDEERNEKFNMMCNSGSLHPYWWDKAEPYWITAVKQGKRTYMFEWPGGDVELGGHKSTFSKPVDTENWAMIADMDQNVKKAVQMFKEDQIDMAGIYVGEIDNEGHALSPDSNEFRQKLQNFDKVLESLFEQLEYEKLTDRVNVVLFSDHGMTAISPDRKTDISSILELPEVKEYTDCGHMCNIWPQNDKLDMIYKELQSKIGQHGKVYKREEIPDRWHYRKCNLLPPLMVVADCGWFIATPQNPEVKSVGWHGFDNADEDMRGIFMSAGPDIKKNYKIGPVRAVDIYQVLCKLLKISPLPNSGEWKRVETMFRENNFV